MGLSERTIGEIADLLKDTKQQETKACLLIGAGVSYTGGIGLASDFVKRIQHEYPKIYEKACTGCAEKISPGYAQCMAALPPAKQVELVRADIDKAKINWAHIGIARMERGGVVDTILTPNFDPLASRACALFNRFPAIYDLAGLRDGNQNILNFDPSFVKGSAIFHMHGQHTGFILLNTAEKLQTQAKRVRPVLDAVMKGKPVIIAGYSGENDPLVDEIAALGPFNHGLYWVCHNSEDPAAPVCEKLLSLDDCHIVRGMPSDKFFTELANALELEAPGFLASPFAHMSAVLETLRPFADVGDSSGDDLLAQAKDQLAEAAKIHAMARPDQQQITTLYTSGQYQLILDRYQDKIQSLAEADRDTVAWAAIRLGIDFLGQAKSGSAADADRLFDQANKKFAMAMDIKPDMHEALNNWGNSLLAQARRKTGADSDNLISQAIEKYDAALKIKHDKHETLYNWGNALSDHAKKMEGAKADALFGQAAEKYAAALDVKPDKYQALNNWGVSLLEQAKMKPASEAGAFFLEAAKKFYEAEKLMEGWSAYNLACVHGLQGQAAEAVIWLRKAFEKAVSFPGCQHITNDHDLDAIRQSPDFQSALVDFGCV